MPRSPLDHEETAAEQAELAEVLAPLGDSGPSLRLYCGSCHRFLETLQAHAGGLGVGGADGDAFAGADAPRQRHLLENRTGPPFSALYVRRCQCGTVVTITKVALGKRYVKAVQTGTRLVLTGTRRAATGLQPARQLSSRRVVVVAEPSGPRGATAKSPFV